MRFISLNQLNVSKSLTNTINLGEQVIKTFWFLYFWSVCFLKLRPIFVSSSLNYGKRYANKKESIFDQWIFAYNFECGTWTSNIEINIFWNKPSLFVVKGQNPHRFVTLFCPFQLSFDIFCQACDKFGFTGVANKASMALLLAILQIHQLQNISK